MTHPTTPDLEVTVVSRRVDAESVVVVELEAVAGSRLPDWQPGAHIDLLLPGDIVRQYSLAGEPGADRWRIGVLREVNGRGGSRWLYDELAEGAVLGVVGPRNHFSFEPPAGAPVLFLAAGIGVTPIVPMARQAAEAGLDYALHYCGHARERMPFLAELVERHGDRLALHVTTEGTRLDVAAQVAAAAPGTVVYACGPKEFLEAVTEAAEAASVVLHLEHFEPADQGAPLWEGPFEVELAISGYTVTVPPEKSILVAVEDSGTMVPWSCTEGTCGSCETPVLEGVVDHRDSILTPEERARMDTMFVCVSRAACPKLVLEL